MHLMLHCTSPTHQRWVQSCCARAQVKIELNRLFRSVQALLLSSGVVKTVGVKGSLVAGSLSYCLYIGSFYFATAAVDERVSFYAAFAGALIGGVAGAVLFTAQGIFFSKTAMLISESSLPGSVDSSLPAVTSKLASVFACIYLFCEVLFKMVATILPRYFNLGFESVFTLYFVLAVAAGLSMSFVHAPDLPQSTISAANGPISCGRELLATLSLLTKDSRAGLNAPYLFVVASVRRSLLVNLVMAMQGYLSARIWRLVLLLYVAIFFSVPS